MKKTLLMAALATISSGAVHAESSVTLYGILDAGVGYSKVDGSFTDPTTGQTVSVKGSRIGMNDSVKNGSRWGLRGREDLGNGLYATFQLESGFNVSDGQSTQGGRLFGREATVGLASDSWGQMKIGRQYNIASRYYYGIFGVSAPLTPFLLAFHGSGIVSFPSDQPEKCTCQANEGRVRPGGNRTWTPSSVRALTPPRTPNVKVWPFQICITGADA